LTVPVQVPDPPVQAQPLSDRQDAGAVTVEQAAGVPAHEARGDHEQPFELRHVVLLVDELHGSGVPPHDPVPPDQ
jgi:hypothetical protein